VHRDRGGGGPKDRVNQPLMRRYIPIGGVGIEFLCPQPPIPRFRSDSSFGGPIRVFGVRFVVWGSNSGVWGFFYVLYVFYDLYNFFITLGGFIHE